MTDFELTSLFYDAMATTDMFMMDYVTLFFAFLVAGYFISDKLAPLMVALIIALFTVISLYLITSLYFAQSDINGITNAIASRMAEGDFPLPDIGPSRTPMRFRLIPQMFATVGSYIGALVFFFYQRKQGLKKLALSTLS